MLDLKRAKPLPPSFYQRDTLRVAQDLLGKILVTRLAGGLVAGEIVEVEAYLGATDPAAHTFRGETPRTRSMFAGGGTCYVYLSYGINYCMNVVTGAPGSGEAVLIRALAPHTNCELMATRRGIDLAGEPRRAAALRRIANGPGKLTQALGIGLAQDGRRFDSAQLKIVDGGIKIAKSQVGISPRIGITKAAALPLRFFIKDSPYLSR